MNTPKTDPVVPLLSACLIVKDEEAMLRPCLESIADLVDEIVVYDTGSSDRTIEIARSAGARVFEGYWDNSFARARNAALAQALGEWILVIDADERFLGDPQTLRALLREQGPDSEAFLMAVDNLQGAGNARMVHTGIRIFRRSAGIYRYRLHEQVVAVDDPDRSLSRSFLTGARLIHYGYVNEVFQGKNKAERNLVLARAALDDEGLSPAYTLMNYGRSLESAGRSEEAVETLKEAALIAEDPSTHRMGLNNLIYILGRLGRFDEALVQVEELRKISVLQIAADIAEGRMRVSMGQVEVGLSILARVPLRGRDDDGMEYTAHTLAPVQGKALAYLGRFAEASDVVLDAIRSEGLFEVDLGELSSWLVAASRSPLEIAEVLDVADLAAVLGRLLHQPVDVADALLEGIWARFPDRLEPLAAAGRLGSRLPVARALVWSARLRAQGLEQGCPLVAMAGNEDLDPRVRILAGVAAFGSFGEHGVINAVHQARGRLDPASLVEADEQIGRLAPGLLEAHHIDIVSVNEVAPVGVPSFIERGRFALVAPQLRVAALARRGGINIVGPFEGTSAEAHVARTLAVALSKRGVKVSTTSYQSNGRSGSEEWTHPDDGDHPFNTSLLVISPEEMASFAMDHGTSAFENRYMIGLWLWDLDRASQIMSMTAPMVHEIWVPSTFTAEAVAQVTDRTVMRMLLPTGPKQSELRETLDTTGFTFLASVDYDTGFERQNPLGLVEAFGKAFRPGQGPQLVIETAHAEHYPAEHARLIAAVAGRPDIVVLGDAHGISGRILSGRVAGRSCFVSLHRSEGTGRVLARAISLGIATIVTAHSFSAELQDGRDSFQIPFILTPIPKDEHRGASEGQWAEPDLDEATKVMRLVFEQPKLAMVKALRAQNRGGRLFSPLASVKDMQNRLSVINHFHHGA